MNCDWQYLGFQIFTIKLILWTKMDISYAIFIVNWSFGKEFLLVLTDLELLMFHNNIVKISEI